MFLAAAAGSIVLLTLPKKAHAAVSRTLYDSVGRNVRCKDAVSKIVPVGIYAQTLVETLCPNALVSLAKNVSTDASDFIDAGLSRITSLPEIDGSGVGLGKNLNKDDIRSLAPHIVIQAGTHASDALDTIDQLEQELDIPLFYADVSYGNLADTYRKLGELLGCEERAENLAYYKKIFL